MGRRIVAVDAEHGLSSQGLCSSETDGVRNRSKRNGIHDSSMNGQSAPSLRGRHCWLGLVAWLAVSFSAAALGSLFMPDAWYAGLRKPSWNPPGWVFGPVWTVLYSAMAVGAWLVWQRGGFAAQRRPLALFCVQLALNAAWTPLFFRMHWIGVALADLLMLCGAIVATLIAFFRVSRVAGWLLMPYLAWVCFAAVLNFTLWNMNR